jgi:hypothetical protein
MDISWWVDMKAEHGAGLDDAEDFVQSGFDWDVGEEKCTVAPV